MPDFRQILATLQKHDVEFLVVGGVAAVLGGAPYFTFDLDIVHRRTPENVDRLIGALTDLQAHYRVRPDKTPETSHLLSSGHQRLKTAYGFLDVLGAIEEGLDYDALLSNTVRFELAPGSSVNALSIETLARLKEGSTDPKHQQQLAMLKNVIRERESS
jgi:hypothetical protein